MNNLILILVLSLLTLTGCSTESINDSYLVTLENHSLSGKIWDVKAKHFIEREVLLENIRQSDFIFLGETHDNNLHHEYQAWVIDNLYTSGFTAFVAMEMINSAQGEIIKNKPYESSVRLIDDLNLVKTTWRYESRYKVLFDKIGRAHV